ncbi:aminotransferase class I/II-fold pyridoxal phosphate-dependent enzyme [Paenibacillus flagellatus]|uniref:Amino acid decarboxylase n=1 Tax=Paenibacillus flagellatus TaxID=2211139 RepID=A0A2V5KP31_9BACL|nr:aminotransferase class I/II-fold pyridoxal phosphate-dependent enzyme [Paenibacillus flagellatus]PYI50196.1 hypothetical protein DLM86_30135 [Paenibacillus flagellatus]
MAKNNAPLLDALLRHRERGTASFHVPGHKSGRGLPPVAGILREMMEIDMTEITGLDDLHHPEGAIREAQRLAASCFGAEETYFLVNGSTVGNLAAITALCGRGDTLIVQRNVHKSVLHGLMLAGAQAVFLTPRFDRRSGLSTGVRTADVETALTMYPEAKGVLLTNPSYYGLGVDLASIAEKVHARGKPLIVDEAHGAHFGFHPALPPSALSGGADLVVQSTHKMLTSMTMGAMLHVQGSRVDRGLLRQRLSMLQSSSPSYPIMASLDAGRLLMETEGAERLDDALRTVERVESYVRDKPWYRTLPAAPADAYETKDPFKVAVSDATGALDGFALRDELELRGMMAEMADSRHTLLVFSLASEPMDADRLIRALDDIAAVHGLANRPTMEALSERLLFDEAPVSEPVRFGMDQQGRSTEVPLLGSAGCVCAEMVVPYPPGIPVLYPGERITGTMVRYINDLAEMGARFQGAADPRFRTIRVFV